MGCRINLISRVHIVSGSEFDESGTTGCHETYRFYRSVKILERTLFEFEILALFRILAQSQMNNRRLIPGSEHPEHQNLL